MKKYVNKIPIIMYHRVLDQKTIDQFPSYNQSCSVLSTTDFIAQIQTLNKRYLIISLNELIYYLKGQGTIPPNSCVLSFDDGYIDHYKNVFPILKNLKFPATFFITGDCIAGTRKVRWLDKFYYILDNTPHKSNEEKLKRILSNFYRVTTKGNGSFNLQRLKTFIRNSSEKEMLINMLADALAVYVNENILNKNLYISEKHIKEMTRYKMDFGAHTMSHPDLGKISFSGAKKEIIDSGNIIKKITNGKQALFAYPFGGKSTYNKKIINVLRSNNFLCACTSVSGLNDKKTSIYELKRIDAINLDKTLLQ